MTEYANPRHPELDSGSKFCKKSYVNYGEFAVIKYQIKNKRDILYT